MESISITTKIKLHLQQNFHILDQLFSANKNNEYSSFLSFQTNFRTITQERMYEVLEPMFGQSA